MTPKCTFPFVPDYDNENETMQMQNQTGLKNSKPNINLNHSIALNYR